MDSFKIIFLDIDGVLNTYDHLRHQERETGSFSGLIWSPDACQNITRLCKRFDARIVVSSTWRLNHNLEELRDFFSDNNIDPVRVIGITPIMIHEEEPEFFSRGEKIQRWLELNSHDSAYVIIDDAPLSSFLEEQRSHLVQVDPDAGFANDKAAKRAAKILKGDMHGS